MALSMLAVFPLTHHHKLQLGSQEGCCKLP